MSQQDKRSRRRRPSDERNDVRRKKRHSNRKNTSDRHRRRRKVKKRENKLSRTIGLVLAIVQLIATGIFMAGIFKLNMLPTKYVVAATVALVLFWGVILASQFFSKKNAITGKIISVLITVLLIFSSYYLFKVSGTVSKISGGEYKLDKVVVSVMADDSAEAIKDAKNYTFGVQYKMNGDQIKQTVQAINEELGTEIKTEEYDTLAEQAEALHDGKVDAIIYNQGFTGVLEEAFEGYEDNTKVIYSHDIKTEIEDTSSDVEVKNDTFSVYISGIDVYGDVSETSRSDVNIIAVVNPQTHQILLVTTPRDYYVPIPGVSGGQRDKLTHAGIYGIDASMKTLGELYETDINYYARLNFTSLIDIVDTLGGIDVYSEFAFTTSKDSEYTMDVQEGYNHFNGKEALAFCRERHNLPDGDNQRGKNQQAVITAMLKKCLSPTMLLKANAIMEQVSKDVETNMSQEQINALIKYQLNNNATWTIQSIAAEGTNTKGTCYSSGDTELFIMEPIESSVQNIIDLVNVVEEGGILTEGEKLN